MKNNKVKVFLSYPEKFRIDLVIHDGNWYTKEKLAKTSKVSLKEVNLYIENNKDRLIHKNDSYRCSYDEVINWYRNKNIDIESELVPRNFPPKVWGGKTETEHFLDSPKTEISSMTVEYTGIDNELFLNIIKQMSYYGKIQHLSNNKIKVLCICSDFIKYKIIQILPENEIEKFVFRSREDFYLRFLVDINSEYLEKSIMFYNWYAYTLLKPQMETIRVFLDTNEAISSKITEWVLTAIQKYDETKTVPFSGYLANVLRSWPYDLPSEEYGKKLSNFHRSRQKILKEHCDKEIDNKELAKMMNISYEEFLEFDNEYNNWKKDKFAEEIVFERNKSNERRTYDIMKQKTTEDISKSHEFSKAILRIFRKTNDAHSAYALLTHNISDISEEFKNELYEEKKKNSF